MTTITIERELLEQALNALSAPNHCVFSEPPICVDIRAALAAPATAPEKTVKEIMEFARHYAANTFSSATLEDKIRRSLAASATAPDEQLRKDAERYRWLRSQHWSDGQLSVVVNAKASVRLGANCPSHELLDEAIDSAMKGKL